MLYIEKSRLKIARKKKGLTQLEAANILGVTPQAWSSTERDASKMHRNTLERVTKLFGVSFSRLATRESASPYRHSNA